MKCPPTPPPLRKPLPTVPSVCRDQHISTGDSNYAHSGFWLVLVEEKAERVWSLRFDIHHVSSWSPPLSPRRLKCKWWRLRCFSKIRSHTPSPALIQQFSTVLQSGFIKHVALEPPSKSFKVKVSFNVLTLRRPFHFDPFDATSSHFGNNICQAYMVS